MSEPASWLILGLHELKIPSPEVLAGRLVAFGELLIDANKATNLVGAKSVADLVAPHFLDSLAPLAGECLLSPIIDVGSGAGFPGIPVSLAFPETKVILFEPRAKRAQFLAGAIAQLGIRNVEVLKLSAETAGRGSWRSNAGTVLIRALGQPKIGLELGLPLLEIGGRLLMYEGKKSTPTTEEIAFALELGASLLKATAIDVPYLDADRHAWWFKKTAESPKEYPRRLKPPPEKHHANTLFHVEHVPIYETDKLLINVLPSAGIYAVGGRVRDEVLAELGRPVDVEPNLDYLVTGTTLDEVIAALRPLGHAELVGSSFGVIKFSNAHGTVDIALPRKELSTGSHHRDFDVRFGPDVSIEDDLARRDFRVNMMARDLRTGAVVDPFGGRDDVIHGRLDALNARVFVEDPLRILRGAQFAARFGFTPTPTTLDAMRAASDLVPTVAAERVTEELTKLLVKSARPSVGFELLREVSVLHHILPELMEGWNVEQNEFHKHTVYYHSLECCDRAPRDPRDPVLRLAALLHDVGKPRTKEGPHFYRHEFVGEEMARAALTRLRFSTEVVERVCELIAHHMYSTDDALTDAAVRRFIRRVKRERVEDQFALRHADVAASGLPARDPDEQARFERRVFAEIERKPPLGVRDLALRGEDVIAILRELGKAGDDFAGDARVGDALKHALEQVLDDPRKNDHAVLRHIVRSFLSGG
jgi:tRNA nucleotidyltransferase (CCA-adding enzyme)